MNAFRRRLQGDSGYKYVPVGRHDSTRSLWTRKHSVLAIFLLAFAAILAFLVSNASDIAKHCDTIQSGYRCSPEISHHWGQYSPYFRVESDPAADIPQGCEVTFAQLLSRHGARDPTFGKGIVYRALFEKLKSNVKHYEGKYAFLADYDYSLGHDQLSIFGQQQLVNSGIKFYQRYRGLGQTSTPFVRASGQKRVIDSAVKWTQGYQHASMMDGSTEEFPGVDVIIPEASGVNNTLSHDLCDEFEGDSMKNIGAAAKATWANMFVPDIQQRINSDLAGANLSIQEIIYLMDICPFDTVASPTGQVSPFCNIFTETEWKQYNYYETLDKWYGYSHGNPLGPTQGVGFVNEAIARMTGQPVRDHTSTNHTLDDDPETFPLDRKMYADFGHDNDMVSAVSAFGFYNQTAPLSNTTIVDAQDADGFSAAWLVPFAARMYFEKMQCHGQDEELVRVLVNDRVLPLSQCNGDQFGRCTLSTFIESLQFARRGGLWDRCFP